MEQQTDKRQADLSVLTEVQYVEVDYDDERWQLILPANYAYCYEAARTGDFPLRHTGGRWKIGYAWFPAYYFNDGPSNEEIVREIELRNGIRPDRAISETVMDILKAELGENSVVAVCGVVQANTDAELVVGCVDESRYGRRYSLSHLRYRWYRSDSVLVVVSEEEI